MSVDVMEARHALSDRSALNAAERLAVTAAGDCARFSLRLAPELRAPAGLCFGAELPPKIGGVSTLGERVALCLGPDEWMLLAPLTDADEIATRFTETLAQPHSLVDIGHRELGLEINGAAAERALAALCALDLAAMPPNSATRTILDKTQVVLLKRAADSYRIEVWQSFASHIWGLLEAVAQEIALDI